MVSWNVAGIPENDIDLFFSEMDELTDWVVLCLQEAFVKTEGIESNSKHVVYTPKYIIPGLRVPAIIVHEKHGGMSQ